MRRGYEPLFAAFAAASALFAANQPLSVFIRSGADGGAGAYLLRLAAFA